MSTSFSLSCIIDDDPIFSFAAGKQMELRSFSEHIISYKNGREAIEDLSRRIRSGEAFPEIILLDINMPVMNGWEFLEALSRETPPPFRLYVVSSSVNPDDISRAESYPIVSGFISKPLPPEMLDTIASGAR